MPTQMPEFVISDVEQFQNHLKGSGASVGVEAEIKWSLLEVRKARK